MSPSGPLRPEAASEVLSALKAQAVAEKVQLKAGETHSESVIQTSDDLITPPHRHLSCTVQVAVMILNRIYSC